MIKDIVSFVNSPEVESVIFFCCSSSEISFKISSFSPIKYSSYGIGFVDWKKKEKRIIYKMKYVFSFYLKLLF